MIRFRGGSLGESLNESMGVTSSKSESGLDLGRLGAAAETSALGPGAVLGAAYGAFAPDFLDLTKPKT